MDDGRLYYHCPPAHSGGVFVFRITISQPARKNQLTISSISDSTVLRFILKTLKPELHEHYQND